MPESPPIVACPTCGKAIAWDRGARWRPFCSERCRLIDLGEWLSEERRVPADDDPWTEPFCDPLPERDVDEDPRP